jgi:subtilisin
MARENTRPMIVTFEKKDQRQDRDIDKQQILQKHLNIRFDFCNVLAMQDMQNVQAYFEELPQGLDVNLYDLPILTGNFTEEEIQSLRSDANVAMVEEDRIAYALPLQRTQETTLTTPLPGLISEDMPGVVAETLPWGVNQIGAERAWEVTRGAGIKVAVIDTGIEHLHHDLAPNFAGGVSFVPGESFTDGNGHGTHVAGIIGARQNGSGVVGVAPNCSLYSVKALNRLGGGQYSWIISSIVWCVRNGIDIINMSLGGPNHVQALENACDYAFQHNVLVVAAAGNAGPREDSVNYPARYGSVIAVSAVDSSRNLANFSSRGEHVDLTAPGVQILSTLPGNRYGRLNGTSMAAPHVTGTAALAFSSHRFTKAETIRQILEKTADNLGTPGRDDLYGNGLVDAEQAAFLRGMPTYH